MHCYEKALYLDDLTDGAIAVVIEHLPRKTSPLSLLHFYPLSGAYAEVGDDDTALGGSRSALRGVHRRAEHDPAACRPSGSGCGPSGHALLPHAAGAGGYVNGLTDYADERVRAAYGPKYHRLAEIKAIRPTTCSASTRTSRRREAAEPAAPVARLPIPATTACGASSQPDPRSQP